MNWIPSLYDTLIREDAQLNPQPQLAESWEFSSDGLSLTFSLRKGVTFHDGRQLEAEDVVYSFNRTKNPDIGANIRGMLAPIGGAEAKDKNTVVFKFEKPYAAVFDALDLLFVIPDESGEDIKTKPVGTGPFSLAQWLPNNMAILKRNPDYWLSGAPVLDQVEIKILSDTQGRVVGLETDTVDMVEAPGYIDFVRLREDQKYQALTAGNGAAILCAYFNVDHEPFDNKKVRQAFSYALDRARITQTYTRGVSQPMCLPWRKEVFAYDATLASTCEFNLDKAKQLLAEAGFPDGFEADVNTSGEGYSPGSKVTAEIFQADLAKIGVKLNIHEYEAAAARPKLVGGDFQVAVHGYGRANRDPATLFGGALPFYNNSAITGYGSDEYGKLIDEGATTLDMNKRKEIYHRLTEIIVDEAVVLTICPRPETYVLRDSVKGFATNLDGMMDLRKVTV
ncbi:MAG: ABC transporter substrate-binding protein [Dehalococcoidales bacterium]|nr:ABC transporter substrate-binding protein [Dehalococcoidales bacterium]